MTMKETVKYVREGWYGNLDEWDNNDDNYLRLTYRDTRKEPTDCNALFNHRIEQANTKFIPICDGISGKLGELLIN
jgi:hypothetical protein